MCMCLRGLSLIDYASVVSFLVILSFLKTAVYLTSLCVFDLAGISTNSACARTSPVYRPCQRRPDVPPTTSESIAEVIALSPLGQNLHHLIASFNYTFHSIFFLLLFF